MRALWKCIFRVVEYQRGLNSYFDSAGGAGFDQDNRCGRGDSRMDEADSLGLEPAGAHRGDKLGASARGEDECDACAGADVTACRGDEVVQRPGALAARETAAVVGIFAAGSSRAIRRIRDDEVEAGGLEAGDFLLAQVRAN